MTDEPGAAGRFEAAEPGGAPLVRYLPGGVNLLVRRLDTLFRHWAARLSRPGVMKCDRWVFWFYFGCLVAFAGMALAGLHGSSLDMFSRHYAWSNVQCDPLLGQPRNIRSDEWAIQTPLFLNQAFRSHAFATDETSCGGKRAVLLFNAPCRDLTQICRPQLWAFHVLPVAAAFAVYWQVKGFLLLTGVFSLFLLLTRGNSGLAALGSSWFYLSAHLQWAFSWASMLPEMVGCFCWTICLTLYLCVGRDWRLLLAAAVGCILCATNFALCCYPPHQIPLVLFGMLLIPTWLFTQRAAVCSREALGARMLLLSGCWIVIFAVVLGFFWEAREAIAAAAETVYPGRRLAGGGDVPLAQFLSNFLDFWKSEYHFPDTQSNICEGTGFLWLLPATAFRIRRLPSGGQARAVWMLRACWVGGVILAGWLMLPFPAAAGHWLLLDHVLPGRCLPALGLMNIAGVTIYLSLHEQRGLRPQRLRYFALRSWHLAVLLGVALVLCMMNESYLEFFRGSQLVWASLYLTVLIVTLIERRSVAFGAALLLPLLWANALVNPVDRGLHVVQRSILFRAVQAQPRLREGRWLVFSTDFAFSSFVVATGANVFNSFKVVPDLRAMAEFDAGHRFSRAYNQSGLTIVRPLPEGEPSRFDDRDAGLVRWWVSPLDPALKRVGIRYLAFDEPPAAAVAAKLRPAGLDVPGMFVYEVP